MRKLTIFVLCVMLTIGCLGLPKTTQSAPPVRSPNADARNRIYWETLRAITPYYYCPCRYKIDGNTVSEWNYLASDVAAYTTVKNWYASCSSSFWRQGDPVNTVCKTWNPKSPDFYTDLNSYGLQYSSQAGGLVGHGGQCKYFANLLLYRSGADTSQMRTYAQMTSYIAPINTAQVGDVIFVPYGHVAIVVAVRYSNGQFAGASVIESNWVGDEIIALRTMTVAQLSGYYVYTGTSYY